MKNLLSYIALTIAFAFLASGAVISAFLDVYTQVDLNILWLLLPMTLLFMATVFIDVRYAIPRLLLNQRYFAYCVSIIGASYAASIISIYIEYAVRLSLGFPSRITDFRSPWIYVDAFSNSILLMLILLGIGARILFLKWTDEANNEKRLADKLKEYIAVIKNHLNPSYIKDSLQCISDSLSVDPSKTASLIRDLSDYLRNQLYEIPVPPITAGHDGARPDYSSLTNFIVSRKYKWIRHTIFQIVLIVISFGSFFNAPDQPEFANKLGGFIAMYIFLNLLTYINVLWLFRRFRRHRSLKRYMIETGALLLLVIIPLIIMETATYDQNPYDKQLPIIIMVISTIGTLLTLFFFIGGTAAIMMHQYWIIGRRRVMLLQAETARQEYAFLKKQINPHFLFNVLNNVGILSVEEPDEAVKMISELQRLIEYQFAETDSNTTTLDREIDFLNSYLSLEGTRIEPFSFEIKSEPDAGNIVIPTLLFIPFVENAVKYSSAIDGKRLVRVTFAKTRDYLEFRCENTFQLRKPTTKRPGGLGISNTLRRLNLLFGDRYSYSRRIIANRYIANVSIPCNIRYS